MTTRPDSGEADARRLAKRELIALLVLLLGVTAFLLRRKEREPGGGDSSNDPYTPARGTGAASR